MKGLRSVLVAIVCSTGCSLVTDLSSLSRDGGGSDASTPDVGADVANDVTGDVTITCDAGKPTLCGSTCTDTTGDSKNCGACGHDCFGGACTSSVCQPVTIASGQLGTTHIAVNATSVVWARGNGSSQTGGIFAANLDGTNPTSLYEGASFSCGALAVDATRMWSYCTDGAIHQCTIAQCTPTTLTNATNVRSLAVDAVASNLYVSIGTVYNQQAGGYIGVVPLSGGSITRVTSVDQPSPTTVLLVNGSVYWVNGGTYTSDVPDHNGGVRKAPAAPNQTATTLDTDFSGEDYEGLFIDSTTAYYGGGNSHEIHSVSLLGGSGSTFASLVTTTSEATSVVGDATYIYWNESDSAGGISRCEKSCTKPVQIVPDAGAYALTQDAKSLYWVNATGEIKRLTK